MPLLLYKRIVHFIRPQIAQLEGLYNIDIGPLLDYNLKVKDLELPQQIRKSFNKSTNANIIKAKNEGRHYNYFKLIGFEAQCSFLEILLYFNQVHNHFKILADGKWNSHKLEIHSLKNMQIPFESTSHFTKYKIVFLKSKKIQIVIDLKDIVQINGFPYWFQLLTDDMIIRFEPKSIFIEKLNEYDRKNVIDSYLVYESKYKIPLYHHLKLCKGSYKYFINYNYNSSNQSL
jgi:hypothetical protein